MRTERDCLPGYPAQGSLAAPCPDPGQQETQAAGVAQGNRSPGDQPSQGPGQGHRGQGHLPAPDAAPRSRQERPGKQARAGTGAPSRAGEHNPRPPGPRRRAPAPHLRRPRAQDGRTDGSGVDGRSAPTAGSGRGYSGKWPPLRFPFQPPGEAALLQALRRGGRLCPGGEGSERRRSLGLGSICPQTAPEEPRPPRIPRLWSPRPEGGVRPGQTLDAPSTWARGLARTRAAHG